MTDRKNVGSVFTCCMKIYKTDDIATPILVNDELQNNLQRNFILFALVQRLMSIRGGSRISGKGVHIY